MVQSIDNSIEGNEESKESQANRWTKYIPTPSEMASGLLFIVFGLLALKGGGIAIQVSPDSEPIWLLQNFTLPSVVCWLMVLLGIDVAILKNKGTGWIFAKIIAPPTKAILNSTVGEDKINHLQAKLAKLESKYGRSSSS